MAQRQAVFAALAAVVGLVFAGTCDFRAPRTAVADGISLQQIASGLSSPTDIKSAGDARLFITEQSGRIRIYDGTAVLPTFLNVSSLISLSTERGLLGLAFHPNYASNGYFYIYYTNTSGNIVIDRYHVSSDANIADPNSRSMVLTIPHPGQSNHNGGSMQFGPDGKLYIGVGDGGGTGDPNNQGQDLSLLLGKLLRIDVDAAPAPYAIPANNPFVSTPGARGEIWAYGLRNPWRFSFDRSTGDLIIGDVGQNAWEEVDFQPAGSGGQNYGWRLMEGTHCYNPPTNCNPGGLTMPILEYPHGTGDCSVTGGYRYRGSTTAARGIYLYGDYCSGRIWRATPSGGTWSSSLLLDTPMTISTFGEDNTGELYVAGYSNGTISRIVLSTDTDGDGCIDVREVGMDHRTGGQRDPNNRWDFFDVPTPALLPSDTTGRRNRAISIADAIAVLAYVGTSASSPNAPNANGATYGSDLNGNGMQDGQEYDRSPGAVPWAPGPPNGAVTIGDALISLNSIGDSCN